MKEIKINNKKIKVTLSVNTTGLYCPMPIVNLKLGLEEVNIDDVVELISDDPGIKEDLPYWCNTTGNTLLSLKRNKDGIFTGYVKKTT